MPAAVKSLRHKDFLQIDKNYEQAAIAARLLYVSDRSPGITRVRKGKGFAYLYQNKPIRDKSAIERIRKLVIPPAWINVWICPVENGHIQATGHDVRHRKQYRYHALWNQLRHETKFHRLLEFGKALPHLRDKLEQDLALPGLSRDKVLAAVISLMERTYIRVGNPEYEKANGSYGLTTLRDKHVQIQGDKVRFSFTGKKGIAQDITIRNKRLARMVQRCRDIPGQELFQFIDEAGERKPIDSGMVNDYIRTASGIDCSAKDFRTWAGSLHALQALRSLGEAITVTEKKKNVVAALTAVSEKLGNTRTVCKKYYVHPRLIELYEEGNLRQYQRELDKAEDNEGNNGLTAEEKVLMKILAQHC
ncbi:MAG: DNA topoisomerase IB [Bacteroidota bacterium]|nr:DNA topoisomerase IB [Bacteroidota bacterium]